MAAHCESGPEVRIWTGRSPFIGAVAFAGKYAAENRFSLTAWYQSTMKTACKSAPDGVLAKDSARDSSPFMLLEEERAALAVQCLTYRQARLVMNHLANAFVSAGLRPGDRIAVLAKNCVENPLTYFAASRVGVVPVPLNYRSAPPEWRYIVQDAEARLLLVGRRFVEAVDAIREERGSVEQVS
jgi:acyl-CoA synthetase (AMP-forming)/AMP-acid ligase II